MIDADYKDDLEFLANTPALAESLQHRLEKATYAISLYVTANKAEFMNKNGPSSLYVAKL